MIGASDLPALEIDAVSVRFGGLVAVNAVSMQVAAGQRWAIIGPNGAGKTTLFRCVSGEVLPTSGSIKLFGEDITHRSAHRRAHKGIGRTYQVTNLFNGLSVLDNMLIAAHGLSRSRFRCWSPVSRGSGPLVDRVEWALDQVRLSQERDRIVKELSHGEQRQLEIAMALVSNPRLLLLDEPAAGLSAAERGMMRELINDLPEDLSLVLIEHDMSIALELVQWVVVLDNGVMIASGSPEEVRSNKQVQDVYLKVE